MTDSNDRFGWNSGEVWTIDDDGNKVRVGEVPESVKIRLKLREKTVTPPAQTAAPRRRRVIVHRG